MDVAASLIYGAGMQLNLPNLKLGLADLCDKREQDLLKCEAGKYYKARIVAVRNDIDALPPALTGGAPLANLLAEEDENHDGYGGAIHFLTEAYLRLPDTPIDLADAANRVRAAFIPELGDLQRSYAIEADKAIARKPKLQERKDDLKRFPVGEKETLYDVAKKFVASGEKLHELLSSRADVPKNSRKDASGLRSRAVGLLFKLREDVQDEIERNPKLPRDLEHRIFGYFDTLYDMQARASQATKATEAKATGAAKADPSDGETKKDPGGSKKDPEAPK